ncbi:MAG TPA: hypothetical protein VGB85_20835 [Nannocystis sp.]|jgi:hypothetical protein
MAFRKFCALGLAATVAVMVAVACDPTEEPETGECALAEGVVAHFSIDAGGWPASGDNLEIAAACTVGAVGPTISLDCDDGGATRAVHVTLMAAPALAVPVEVGASVDLVLRRKADAAPDRGFFRLRGSDGALLLAGARSYSSTPGADAQFFAPLKVSLDLKTCEERKTDECRLEQKVVLVVDDGAASTRVPHGSATTLPSGYELRVGRAMLSQASGDPKVCPLDDTTPETYEYLIAAPAK